MNCILTHVDGLGRSLCLELCPLAATIGDGAGRESQLYLHHKDGHRIPVLVRVSTLKDSAGNIFGAIEVFTDISNIYTNSLRVLELEKLALLDNLTQLANRHYIERELQVRIEESNRLKISFGVLFIDIDHFKTVNDTHGHDDTKLQVTVSIGATSIKENDSPASQIKRADALLYNI